VTDGSIELPPPPAAPPRPSPFSRLVGVLFNPVETLASIARQPDILVPLVLFMVLTVFGGIAVAKRVDFGTSMREQFEKSGRLTPEQVDKQVKMSVTVAKVFAYASPILAVMVFAIVASIMMLAYRLMGGEGEFKHYFSVTLYAWVPQMIKSVLTTILLFAKAQTVSAEQLETVVRSSPAFLVDVHTQRVLFTFLSSLDIFTIWSAILMIIGFAFAAKMSKGKSAAIFITVWIFWTGLKLVPAALQSMMGSSK
jgi:hypothetical protein